MRIRSFCVEKYFRKKEPVLAQFDGQSKCIKLTIDANIQLTIYISQKEHRKLIK
jgi:hypothetical protein